jgi:hypothetical protein
MGNLMCGFHDTLVEFRVVANRRAPASCLSFLGTIGRLNDTKPGILKANVVSVVSAQCGAAPSSRNLMQCVGSM